MKIRIFAIVALVSLAGPLNAESELPDCYSFFSQPELSSSAELRNIATSCPIEELAELYERRSEHLELINKSIEVATQTQPKDDFNRLLQSHRIYVSLIEAFSIHYKGNLGQLIGELNKGYDDALELARLRLMGEQKKVQWIKWFKALGSDNE